MPDFQNPTGALMTPRTRRAVAESAARHRVTVVAGETMRDLDLRDPDLRQGAGCGAAPPRIRRALLIGSAARTVWGGLRIGWIRGPAGLIGELCRDPLCPPLAASPMQQLVAAELLGDPMPVLLRAGRSCGGSVRPPGRAWGGGVPWPGLRGRSAVALHRS
ncbi:hypothetical protein B7755_030235 [Streptomyces sp. NBS 14/10]|uniref:hypothetical protein n=1 Tax=Streptomyces sp. NBS 14/10 TaxID=1945643 RepID=UPI000B7E7C50|nr:hypothetical protein [Streptomyces sp. NBS 14/10]KAK1182040.1 hypothetical protein B7755_030235 [Streptomyces sp. NBS 14/10]NUS85749.1 hypothetical protein [Streptomyces sp.]